MCDLFLALPDWLATPQRSMLSDRFGQPTVATKQCFNTANHRRACQQERNQGGRGQGGGGGGGREGGGGGGGGGGGEPVPFGRSAKKP